MQDFTFLHVHLQYTTMIYEVKNKYRLNATMHWLLLSWTFFSLTFEISSPLPHQDQFPSLFLRPNYVEHEHGAAIAGRAKYFCNLTNFRGLPFLHEWHLLFLRTQKRHLRCLGSKRMGSAKIMDNSEIMVEKDVNEVVKHYFHRQVLLHDSVRELLPLVWLVRRFFGLFCFFSLFRSSGVVRN